MIIVTGHMGFIGSHLYRELAKSESVIGYDKKAGVDLAGDSPLLGILLESPAPRVIVHLASSVSTLGSINNPEQTLRDTLMTTVAVMKAAAGNKTPVILTSSVKARDGKTPYGAAKVMAEKWAMEMATLYGIPLVINRPGTIYGPGQEGSTESGWIAWFLKCKKNNMPVEISGNGEQVRDLLHVDDYVRLLRMQIDDLQPRDHGGTIDLRHHEFPTYDFRLGANPPSIWDVGGGMGNLVSVKQMAEKLGLKYELVPERYGDAWRYQGENRVPGWQPRIHWRKNEMFQ